MCSVEKRGPIFVLTLTGSDEHRLSLDLIARIRSALAQIRSESLSSSSPSVLVTVSTGKFFSNGLDLNHALAAKTPLDRSTRLSAMITAFIPLVADLLSLPMPTIAAVTGHAAAGGFMLALSHDYIVMQSDRAVIYMSEMDLGLPFPPYILTLMREKMGDLGLFKKIVMESGKVGAKEATEKGVVDAVVGSAEEAVEKAMATAEGFAKRGWNGRAYASTRLLAFPETRRAVGLPDETDEDRRKLTLSSL